MTLDLMKLTELCAEFNHAAEARMKADHAALQQKALEALKPEELEELEILAMELAMGGLAAAFGNISDEFLQLNIKMAEKTADLALRILPEDTVRGDLPEALKNDEAIAALLANNAPTLARLAGPK